MGCLVSGDMATGNILRPQTQNMILGPASFQFWKLLRLHTEKFKLLIVKMNIKIKI